MVEGGDSLPLLHSHETLSGVLHSALGYTAQKSHGRLGIFPEEDDKDDQKAGASLLWKKTERVGLV